MSRERPFFQVDVFGSRPFGGNPLAVVVDSEDLTTEQMQEISRWTNLSECTFLLPPSTPEADYRVRIFSLDRELPFAGHPTLGAARAWLEAGNQPRQSGIIVQECLAGLIPIRYDDELSFAAPPLVRSGALQPDQRKTIASFLGIKESVMVDAAWIDNGPGWLGVLLPSADDVLALRPDVSRASGWDVLDVGAIGPYPFGEDHAFEIRAFFSDTRGQLHEDPVTGSLNASAAQWMIDTGRATAPYSVRQGTALGRSGRINVQSSEGELWVGGTTTVVIRGSIAI